MRIQSIPAVYAFFQGRPVDAFVGALPESQVKAFVDKLAKLAAGDAGAVEDALAEAKQLADAGDHQGAGEIYSQIVQHDPTVAAAVAGLARALIALGDAKGAAKAIDQASETVRKSPEVAAVKTLLDLSRETAGAAAKVPELMARLERDKADHAARYDLSLALYGAGKREGAVDALLEIIRRDREWNEQAARKQLLKLFEAFGPTDPLTVSGRRRLSSILFS
jgi:putative thioredoxin